MTIDLKSPAFDDGDTIPDQYASWPGSRRSSVGGSPVTIQCTNRPLGASGSSTTSASSRVPSGTPDHSSGGNWSAPSLPEGAVEGRNDFGETGYGGPQPPAGDAPHRYVFRLLALDDVAALEPGADYRRFHDAVQGRERARGELTGRYAR